MSQINPKPGDEMAIVWNWTDGGPRFRLCQVKRLTRKQVVVDDGGRDERFWIETALQVGGTSTLMTQAEAVEYQQAWRLRNAQRAAASLGRPVGVR